MANLLVKGAAFPGSPSTGDPFFRDDLGFWCYYDGTRWLTVNEYSVGRAAFTLSADALNHVGITRNDYALYFTRINLALIVATTNDGSNYWSYEVRSYTETVGANTVVLSGNTSSDSADTWTSHTATPSTQNPANYGNLHLDLAKTSSPGNITAHITANYRLIVT